MQHARQAKMSGTIQELEAVEKQNFRMEYEVTAHENALKVHRLHRDTTSACVSSFLMCASS